MREILNHKSIALIEKYNRYYIRFEFGQHCMYTCDMHITKELAEIILHDHSQIEIILNDFLESKNVTTDYFINVAIKDYLFFEFNITEKEKILETLRLLDRDKFAKVELYRVLMNGKFPQSNSYTVNGKNAELLVQSTDMNLCEIYNHLITLKNTIN